jgi:hypothetical protein
MIVKIEVIISSYLLVNDNNTKLDNILVIFSNIIGRNE